MVEHGLGADHAALHRGMIALDLRHVEEAGGIADQAAAGEGQLRDRLEAALAQRPRAVGNTPPALKVLADIRVQLEALELVERRQMRVLVVKPDDEADGDLIVLHMVHPRPAIGLGIHRPADGVDDQTFLVLGRIDLPQLLDADAVGLRIDALAKLEALHQPLGQRTPATLREDGLLGVQLHARRVVVGMLTVLADAHVAGGDALDRAVLVDTAPRPPRIRDRSRRPAPRPEPPASGRTSRG